MKIDTIYLKNWMSYKEDKIDLTDTRLCVLMGHNGSGKSAIIEAITYALFGVARVTDSRGAGIDLLIHDQEVQMWVRVNWTMNGVKYSLQRKRIRDTSTFLDLEIDGSVFEGKIAEVQSMINQTLGVTHSIWNITMNALQERVSILSAKSTERKEMLATLLQLEEYDKHEKRVGEELSLCKQDYKHAEEEYDRVVKEHSRLYDLNLDKLIEQKSVQLERVELELETLLLDSKDEQQKFSQLKQLKEQQHKNSTQLYSLERELRENESKESITKSTLKKILDLPEPEHYTKSIVDVERLIEQQETESHDLELKKSNIEESLTFVLQELNVKKIEHTQHSKRLKKITNTAQETTCETCEGPIDQDRVSKIVVELQLELVKTQEIISNKQQQVDQLETSLEKVNELFKSVSSRLRGAHSSRDKLVIELKNRVEVLEPQVEYLKETISSQEKKSDHLREELVTVEKRQEDLTTLVKELETTVNPDFLKQTSLLTQQAQHLKEEIFESNTSKISLNNLSKEKQRRGGVCVDTRERIRLLDKLKRSLSKNGIPLKIIENTLPLLEARANATLQQLDSDLRLEFSTVKELKSGKQTNTLDIWVLDQNGQRKLVELHSGGERLRLDLALRIACCDFLSANSQQAPLQTLLLDEFFAPLDEIGQDKIMNILDHTANVLDLRVLFITHNSLVQEYVSDRFLVEKREGESKTIKV